MIAAPRHGLRYLPNSSACSEAASVARVVQWGLHLIPLAMLPLGGVDVSGSGTAPVIGLASSLKSCGSKTGQVVGLAGWLVACLFAAAVGGAASVHASPFFTQLVRPGWAPPPSIFGPVWTILYALMGIAAWLIRRVDGFRGAKTAITLFVAQLALNALWSWLFFGWNRGALAFTDILLLWTLILATMISFWRVKPLASILLVPYLLWVTFASALNYSLWQLNPQVLG